MIGIILEGYLKSMNSDSSYDESMNLHTQLEQKKRNKLKVSGALGLVSLRPTRDLSLDFVKELTCFGQLMKP